MQTMQSMPCDTSSLQPQKYSPSGVLQLTVYTRKMTSPCRGRRILRDIILIICMETRCNFDIVG